MSLLSALATGAGLLSGIGQNNRADAYEQQALDQARHNQQLAQFYDQQRASAADSLGAAGYGDPTARIAALEHSYGVAEGIGAGNAAMAGQVAGYRPGDTSLVSAVRGVSQQGQSQLALQEQSARDAAAQQRMQLLSMYAPTAQMQANAEYGNALQNYGQQQHVDTSGLISGLGETDFSFLSPSGSKHPGLDSPYPLTGTYRQYLPKMGQALGAIQW